MSFHFYLYRAAEALPPLDQWDAMHAEPLGDQQQVAAQLSLLFDGLPWDRSGDVWIAQRAGPAAAHLDILLRAEDDGLVRFVVMNKAAPSVMRKVCEALNLNYVAAPEAGDLVDIHAYEDNDPHYKRKNSQP